MNPSSENPAHARATNESPLSESISIVIAGIRNAGKSSLLNTLFEKEVAIVSPVAGTTTDPVVRKMELPGLGPVAFIDTAGIDDEGELGAMRTQKTKARLASSSIVVFASPAHRAPQPQEIRFLEQLKSSKKPYISVLTHTDCGFDAAKLQWLSKEQYIAVDNLKGYGAAEVRKALSALKDIVHFEPSPLEGLVQEGDTILLVAPVDLAAPKGRLIQPQVETIRDGLDRDCTVIIVKERELLETYNRLMEKPRLVITDSQAFSKVAADIDPDQPLTSFSILFARKKGELDTFLRGISALNNIPAGGHVAVMEACSHHRQADDIATVKIPRLFQQLVQPNARFSVARSLEVVKTMPCDLIIHCASCMLNETAVHARMEAIAGLGIPVTNYGLFFAWANGLLPRALEPFPEYEMVYRPFFRNGHAT